MRALVRRIDALFDAEGSIRALCLLRILAGPIVLLHLAPFLERMAEGHYYADSFYDAWVDWYPEAPREVYFALLALCCVAAVLMALGLWSRTATIATFALVAYNFFLSETHFRHNRHFLLVFLMVLSLVDVGRWYSLDAWRRSRRGDAPSEDAPLWPLWLLRVLAATPYLASGCSKLVDPDWWSGLVTWDRVTRYRHFVERSPLPEQAVALVTSRGFHELFGKVAIFTELFLAVGLWFPRTRYLAVWVAVCFHATIEVTARVQVFSWLAIAGLLVWAVPRTRDRELVLRDDRRVGRVVGVLVQRLDWLARFRVTWTRDPGAPPVVMLDRDGTRYRGGSAVRHALGRLPLLAWPLLPLSGWRGGGRSRTRADPARAR